MANKTSFGTPAYENPRSVDVPPAGDWRDTGSYTRTKLDPMGRPDAALGIRGDRPIAKGSVVPGGRVVRADSISPSVRALEPDGNRFSEAPAAEGRAMVKAARAKAARRGY